MTLNFLEINVLTVGNYEAISNVGPGDLGTDDTIANQASDTRNDVDEEDGG